ncbi:AbiH family protein [Sphingobacterium bovisgrunnientis]|uniref:AbiH family protein n=1 Tax=Sphingobacterium bovisgrunnientis TaxID=1874697 RepID=UPI00135BEF0A|nr:AbiH family protein [Sphingobacterium bovisgrunnientis]
MDKFNTGTLIDFLNNFKSQSGGKYTLIDESDLEILFHNSHISQKKLVFKIKNLFFLHILNKSLNNWVDVEQEYYYLLLKLSNGEMLFNKSFYNINELNEDFKQIKDLLDIYISEEIDMKYLFNSEIKINNSILESFAYNIKYLKDGMDDDYLNEFDPSYKDNLIRFDNKALELYNSSSTAINDLNFENLFLDFNYSKNIENYIKTLNSQNKDSKPRCFGKSKLIKIHGEASNQNNVINFGFGDEMDSNYKTIENINDNRFLDNIKSFMYLNNSNYRDLLNWIENNDFQVFIMGHSCGLSDRTLLNTIFEHHNCKSY